MRLFVAIVFAGLITPVFSNAQTLRHPKAMIDQLQSTDLAFLATEARQRGDSHRGALLFYRSAAACGHCHLPSEGRPPVGPDLTGLDSVTDRHVIESLLFPSRVIRQGFETSRLLTEDGSLLVGRIVARNEQAVTIRSALQPSVDQVIATDDITAIRQDNRSMMPDGLINSIGELRDFYDLAKYVMEVAQGGAPVAEKLKPSADELVVRDDTANLDHAGIITSLRSRDFEAGKVIYDGYCFDCHGKDGNRASLPTARAFRNDKLRFGADPYSMFATLSHGNGLMSAMTHLTPKQRYQVIHYIREAFLKPSNPEYKLTTKEYLKQLPKGDRDGTEIPIVDRDHGPALASQLKRDYPSVLNIRLEDLSIAFDLHTMDQAEVWKGGFLDLSETQHQRDRGEGTPLPIGKPIDAWSVWRFGHEGELNHAPARTSRPARGPMGRRWMHYQGHHLHGSSVIMSYSIDGRAILHRPRRIKDGIAHTLSIGPGPALVLATAKTSVEKALIGDIEAAEWSVQDETWVLTIPADSNHRLIEVALFESRDPEAVASYRQASSEDPPPDPQSLTSGGPLRWPDPVSTIGTLGLEKGAYALDTITLPDGTPWNTWFRTSAIDFFSDGRLVVATYGGDVWIVSGVDDGLLNLSWKRFAAGLYEPFGLKVVEDKIFVTCKDRLVRLHDKNDDGEADFVENFHADDDVSVNFHAFNFDLQVDNAGNFYYAKSGHGSDSDVPGSVIQVSRDGKHSKIFCTGFRTPNGMGMLPDGRPTASDNQGQWMPASKINLLREGGFYGWVPTYSIPGMWEPGGGEIDVAAVVPPTSFDPPIVWMPQDFDNSSGGQLWVDDQRWGPLSRRLLHTSFGKGWMSYLMMQEVEDVTQAAIIKLPFDFRTGIMRGSVNPADGQVYVVGLQGWNGGGRAGLREGGIQRLRYTGKPDRFVVDAKVVADGLHLRFNFRVDTSAAENPDSYAIQAWDYRWRSSYGSDRYSPTTGEIGVDRMPVKSVRLDGDQKGVTLVVDGLQPVDQLHLTLQIDDSKRQPFGEEIYWTIHQVPGPQAPSHQAPE